MMRKTSGRKTKSEYLAVYREKKLAAGGHLVNVYLPAHLVEILDQMKEDEGMRGRAPIISEALEVYFMNRNRMA